MEKKKYALSIVENPGHVLLVMKHMKKTFKIVLALKIVPVSFLFKYIFNQNLLKFSNFFFQFFLILKLTLISDGCPCPEFDCSILDELSESCSDLQSNENYQICYENEKRKLNECLDGCNDSICQKICSVTFHSALENCPCGSNCPCKILIIYIHY